MTKFLYVAIAIVAVAGGVTLVRVWVKPEVVYVPVPAATPPNTPTHPPVDHGSFKDRFQPKMPPPDGGRYSR
jgi:hypothetical protein